MGQCLSQPLSFSNSPTATVIELRGAGITAAGGLLDLLQGRSIFHGRRDKVCRHRMS